MSVVTNGRVLVLIWRNGGIVISFLSPGVDPATTRSENEKKTPGERLLAYSGFRSVELEMSLEKVSLECQQRK